MKDLDDVPLKQNPRLQLLFLPPVIAAGCLITALAWKQFGRGVELKELEEYQTKRQIVTPGSRGIITDRNGNVLADNVPRFGLALDLGRMKLDFRARYRDLRNDHVKNGISFKSNKLEEQARLEVVTQLVERVNRLLGRSYVVTTEQIESHLGNKRLLPLPIVRDLTEEEFAKVMELLPVDSAFERHVTVARRYPNANSACHVVGYVSERDRLSLAAVVKPEVLVEAVRAEALKLQAERKLSGLPEMGAAESLAEAAPMVLQTICDRLGAAMGKAIAVDEEAVRSYYEKRTGPSARPYLNPRKGAPLNLIAGMTDAEARRLRDVLPKDLPVEFHNTLQRYPLGADASDGNEALGGEVASTLENTRNLITYRERGLAGLDGVERSFEDELRGEDGYEVWLVDPTGTRQQRLEYKEPARGRDLALSLDLSLQKATESALGSGFGAAVMVDVKTGEILSMASKPDFDLNLFSPSISVQAFDAISDRNAFFNLAMQGLYPPASTFKLVTSVAGMRTGVLDTMGSVVCTGHVMIGGIKFHCHERLTGHSDPPDYRPLNFEQAFMVSCNPFFYKTGLAVGVDKLSETSRLFGLHQKTGIELPNETSRMIVPDPFWKEVHTLTKWFEGDTANFSIGQGFLRVTPLQMAALTASIARGETRTKLTLRKLPEGAIISHGGGPIPIRADQLASLRHGMELVTMGRDGDWRGTALNVPVPGLTVAGKTGTAQFQTDGQALNLAWFVGYAPADNPKVAMAVLVEGRMPDPSTGGGFLIRPVSGGKIAGAVAHQMLEAWFATQPK